MFRVSSPGLRRSHLKKFRMSSLDLQKMILCILSYYLAIKTPRTRLGRGVRLLGSHNIGVCVSYMYCCIMSCNVYSRSVLYVWERRRMNNHRHQGKGHAAS